MTPVFKFDSEATAKADPIISQYWFEDDGWRGDKVVPNMTAGVTVQVWDPANDATDGAGNVTHSYEAGFFMRINDPSNAALSPLAYALPDGWQVSPCF